MGHIFEITVMRLAPPLESIRWFERALRKLGLTSDALALACVCVKKVSFSRGGALSGVVRIMRGERPPGLADRNAWGTGVVTLARLCFGAAATVWLAGRSHGVLCQNLPVAAEQQLSLATPLRGTR
jgi:hypothetical protein